MREVERESEPRERIEQETGGYVQAFVYRVPKKNHDEFARVEGRLAEIFREQGILRTDLYALTEGKIFKGFASVAESVSAGPDEEVWLELDFYRDQRDRDEVVGRIGQDQRAGPLFGQVLALCTPGSTPLQGDFSRPSI
jgi:uncharacterized protein YbaA (DUF1428 family)